MKSVAHFDPTVLSILVELASFAISISSKQYYYTSSREMCIKIYIQVGSVTLYIIEGSVAPL